MACLIKKQKASIPLENWAKDMSEKFRGVTTAATTIFVYLLSAQQTVRHCQAADSTVKNTLHALSHLILTTTL